MADRFIRIDLSKAALGVHARSDGAAFRVPDTQADVRRSSASPRSRATRAPSAARARSGAAARSCAPRSTWPRCRVCAATPRSAFYRRLVAAGKPKKAALIAAAHKLLTILNTIARDGTTWSPPAASPA